MIKFLDISFESGLKFVTPSGQRIGIIIRESSDKSEYDVQFHDGKRIWVNAENLEVVSEAR